MFIIYDKSQNNLLISKEIYEKEKEHISTYFKNCSFEEIDNFFNYHFFEREAPKLDYEKGFFNGEEISNFKNCLFCKKKIECKINDLYTSCTSFSISKKFSTDVESILNKHFASNYKIIHAKGV